MVFNVEHPINHTYYFSYDMALGESCDEKQFWSDNGYTRYVVKCVRSKVKPAFTVRLKTVMTCEWGNCRNGGGSG